MPNGINEAIAEAKTLREIALKNAKQALEESFNPTLQSMIAKRLREEDEEDFEDDDVDVDVNVDTDDTDASFDDDEFGDDEIEEEFEDEDDDVDVDVDVDVDDEEDFGDDELEELMRELDSDSEEDFEDDDVDVDISVDADDDEELDLDEIIKSLQEMDDEEDFESDDEEDIELDEIIKMLKEMDDESQENPELEISEKSLRRENRNLKRRALRAENAIKTLRTQINEVNLLNAKLLYATKVFNKYNLSKQQKIRFVEAFDRAQDVRDVKLVYTTICESISTSSKSGVLKESTASRRVASTKPSKKIVNENSTVSRLQKLANINL